MYSFSEAGAQFLLGYTPDYLLGDCQKITIKSLTSVPFRVCFPDVPSEKITAP
jgi:hypothetical protein